MKKGSGNRGRLISLIREMPRTPQELCDALWPGKPVDAALNCLRVHMAKLRGQGYRIESYRADGIRYYRLIEGENRSAA